jgi:nucleotide-binding universal stress UspA family protein
MTPKHLLVPTDGSALALKAMAEAVALAKPLAARITVLTAEAAVPMPLTGIGPGRDPALLESLVAARHQESEAALAAACALAVEAGIPVAGERVKDDIPHRAILAAVARLGCDLIVMASHGRRGMEGLLLGSETQRVLLRATVPVLVVR